MQRVVGEKVLVLDEKLGQMENYVNGIHHG